MAVVALVFNWVCSSYFFDANHVIKFSARTNIIYDAIYFIVGGLCYLYRKELGNFVLKHKVVVGVTMFFAIAAYFAIGASTLTILFFCFVSLVYTLGCNTGGGIGQSGCQIPRWYLLRDLPVPYGNLSCT